MTLPNVLLHSSAKVKVQETDVRTVECPATLPAGSFRVTFEAFRLRYSQELKLLERPACPGQEPHASNSGGASPSACSIREGDFSHNWSQGETPWPSQRIPVTRSEVVVPGCFVTLMALRASVTC